MPPKITLLDITINGGVGLVPRLDATIRAGLAGVRPPAAQPYLGAKVIRFTAIADKPKGLEPLANLARQKWHCWRYRRFTEWSCDPN